MTRIVLDTNVIVSALVFGGKPAAVLQAAESGAFQLVVSAEIKSELVETLTINSVGPERERSKRAASYGTKPGGWSARAKSKGAATRTTITFSVAPWRREPRSLLAATAIFWCCIPSAAWKYSRPLSSWPGASGIEKDEIMDACPTTVTAAR